jgi:hypothetical protein
VKSVLQTLSLPLKIKVFANIHSGAKKVISRYDLPVLTVSSDIRFEFVVESSKDVCELVKLSVTFFLESFFCSLQIGRSKLKLFFPILNF